LASLDWIATACGLAMTTFRHCEERSDVAVQSKQAQPAELDRHGLRPRDDAAQARSACPGGAVLLIL